MGGDKPPLVMLHGLTGSGACLTPLGRMLRDDFDVILPDARGHGRSSSTGSGYSYPQLAADAIGLVKELGLNAPILLGHSMGGMTAAVMASLPEPRLAGLVLIEPTFISAERQREVFESDVAAEHVRSLQQSPSELRLRASRRSPRRSAELIEHLVEAKLRTDPDAFQVLRPPNPDYRELIRLARVPILLIIGEYGIVPPDAARELQQLNPLVRLETIAGAGHGLPYDEPGRVTEAVFTFVGELSALGVNRVR